MGKIGKYSVDIEINGVEGNVIPSSISFSLNDSIYSLYSRATLEINDLEGYGLESRLFTSGSKIAFIFGYDDEVIKTHFVINSMETQEGAKPGQLGGKLKIDLIQESFATSERRAQSLSSKPSDSIKSIFNFKFKSYEIEETLDLNIDRLYRPLLTEEETLNNVLLPNSLSANTKPSAYFCFINVNGKLTYKSFSAMLKAEASYPLFQTLTDELDEYYSKIYSIYPFTEKFENSKDTIVQTLSYFNNKNGNYNEEEIKIASTDFGSYPIYKTTISPKPYCMNIENPDLTIRNKAHIHYSQRDFLLPDKLIITTPLFMGYTSGKTVTINTRYGNNEASYSYSKKYLVERTSHVWNGKSNQGLSQLIISKASPEYPANSTIKRSLFK